MLVSSSHSVFTLIRRINQPVISYTSDEVVRTKVHNRFIIGRRCSEVGEEAH